MEDTDGSNHEKTTSHNVMSYTHTTNGTEHRYQRSLRVGGALFPDVSSSLRETLLRSRGHISEALQYGRHLSVCCQFGQPFFENNCWVFSIPIVHQPIANNDGALSSSSRSRLPHPPPSFIKLSKHIFEHIICIFVCGPVRK